MKSVIGNLIAPLEEEELGDLDQVTRDQVKKSWRMLPNFIKLKDIDEGLV